MPKMKYVLCLEWLTIVTAVTSFNLTAILPRQPQSQRSSDALIGLQIAIEEMREKYQCNLNLLTVMQPSEEKFASVYLETLFQDSQSIIITSASSESLCKIASSAQLVSSRIVLSQRCHSEFDQKIQQGETGTQMGSIFPLIATPDQNIQVVCELMKECNRTKRSYVISFGTQSAKLPANCSKFQWSLSASTDNEIDAIFGTISNDTKADGLKGCSIVLNSNDNEILKRKAIISMVKFGISTYYGYLIVWINGISQPQTNLTDGHIFVSNINNSDAAAISYKKRYFAHNNSSFLSDEIVAMYNAAAMLCEARYQSSSNIISSFKSKKFMHLSGETYYGINNWRFSNIFVLRQRNNHLQAIGYKLNTGRLSINSAILHSTVKKCEISSKGYRSQIPCHCSPQTHLSNCILPTIFGAGHSRYFDGKNDIIRVESQEFSKNINQTLMAWIKIPKFPAFYHELGIFLLGHPSETGISLSLQAQGDFENYQLSSYSKEYEEQIVECFNGNSSHDPDSILRASPIPPLENGDWHHVALSQDKNSFCLFINGQSLRRCTYNHTKSVFKAFKNGNAIHIGLNSIEDSGNKKAFFGIMDEARYFKKYLQQHEIQDMMHRTLTFEEQKDLLLWLTFDGRELIDSSPYNHHLKVGNSLYYRSPKVKSSDAPIAGTTLIVDKRQIPNKKTKRYASKKVHNSHPYLLATLSEYSSPQNKSYTVEINECSDLHKGTLYYGQNLSRSTSLPMYPVIFKHQSYVQLGYTPVAGFVGNVTCSVNLVTFLNASHEVDIKSSLIVFEVYQNIRPVVGNAGGAIKCDGVNDYMLNPYFSWPVKEYTTQTAGNITKFLGGAPITIEYWAYVDEGSIRDSAILSIGNGEQAVDWIDRYSPLSSKKIGRVVAHTPNEANEADLMIGSYSKVSIKISEYKNSWIFVSAIHEQASGSRMALYINGKLIEESKHDNVGVGQYAQQKILSVVPAGTKIQSIMICGWSYWSEVYHKGILDEIRIWEGARTSQQIEDSMHSTLSGRENSLLGYWNFDEYSQFSPQSKPEYYMVKDLSKHGHDLVFGGCAPCEDYFMGWHPFPRGFLNATDFDEKCGIIRDKAHVNLCGRKVCSPSAKSKRSEYYSPDTGLVFGSYPCFYDPLAPLKKQRIFGDLNTFPSRIESTAPFGGSVFMQNVFPNSSTIILLNGSDPNGDALQFIIAAFPKHGLLYIKSAASNNSVQLLPSHGILPRGTNTIMFKAKTIMRTKQRLLMGGYYFDSFTYYVSDGLLDSKKATVQLNGFCPPGTFLRKQKKNSTDTGTGLCFPCSPGHFNSKATLGKPTCDPCPANTFQSKSNSIECHTCLDDTYSTKGSSVCKPCSLKSHVYEVSSFIASKGCRPYLSKSSSSLVLFLNLSYPNSHPGEMFIASAPQYGALHHAKIGGNAAYSLGEDISSKLRKAGEIVSYFAKTIVDTDFECNPPFSSHGILGPPDILSHGSARNVNKSVPICNNHKKTQSITLKFQAKLYANSLTMYENFNGGTLAAIHVLCNNTWTQVLWREFNEMSALKRLNAKIYIKKKYNLCSRCNSDIVRITFRILNSGKNPEIDAVKLSGVKEIDDFIFSPIMNTSEPLIYSISKGIDRSKMLNDAFGIVIKGCHYSDSSSNSVLSSGGSESYVIPIRIANIEDNSIEAITLFVIGFSSAMACLFASLCGWWCNTRRLKRNAEDLKLQLTTEMNRVPRSSLVPSDQITVGKLLGKGSAGFVYLGTLRGSIVAIKKLDNANSIPVEQLREEIEVEARVMSALRHPNIVMFMGCCLDDNNICIISQYCERGSLRDVLSNAAVDLPWRLRLKLALGSVSGLKYMHSFDPPLIHRDIKSLNILVGESWDAKLADFGTLRVAKVMQTDLKGKDNLMSAEVGTLRWAAPETIIGRSIGNSSCNFELNSNKPLIQTYSHKVDIYSMGIVLWEIVTRKIPYSDFDFLHQVERQVLKGFRPLIPQDLPTPYTDLIRKCWDVDPSNRPTASEMHDKLLQMCNTFDKTYGVYSEDYSGRPAYESTNAVVGNESSSSTVRTSSSWMHTNLSLKTKDSWKALAQNAERKKTTLCGNYSKASHNLSALPCGGQSLEYFKL